LSPSRPQPAELVEKYRKFVRKIAWTIRRQYHLKTDIEELEAAGFEGLLQALEVYDPSRGVEFHTFSYYRVRGAILDNCRNLGLIRRQYGKAARLAVAANDILENAGEPATDQGALGPWLAQTLDELAVSFTLSQRAPDMLSQHDRPPDVRVESAQIQAILANKLDLLCEDERSVIDDYYFKDKTMGIIAKERGVSKSWVSRVHTRAIRRLRVFMGE
jgi:RNA polymerase sigma factor for flagellar operon FliA